MNAMDWGIAWLFATLLTVPLSGEVTLGLMTLLALGLLPHAILAQRGHGMPWRDLLLLALAVGSITLVKAASLLWSVDVPATVRDIGTHAHFLFLLPLMLLFSRARSPLQSMLAGVRLSALILAGWVLWHWLQHGPPPLSFRRLEAGAQNAGVLGQLATICTLWLAWAWRRSLGRWGLLWVLLSAATVIAAGGRSHIGTLLLGLFLVFVLTPRAPRSLTWWIRSFAGAALVVAVVAYAFAPRLEKAWVEASQYVSAPAKAVRTSVGNRVGLYDAARRAFPDSPWIGFGGGTSRKVVRQYTQVKGKFIATSHYHQQVIQVLMETGVLGLLLCLVALAWISRWYRRCCTTDPRIWPLYACLLYTTAMVGMFTGSLQQGLLHTFIVAALATLAAQGLRSGQSGQAAGAAA